MREEGRREWDEGGGIRGGGLIPWCSFIVYRPQVGVLMQASQAPQWGQWLYDMGSACRLLRNGRLLSTTTLLPARTTRWCTRLLWWACSCWITRGCPSPPPLRWPIVLYQVRMHAPLGVMVHQLREPVYCDGASAEGACVV